MELKICLMVKSLLFALTGVGVGKNNTRSRSKMDRLRNTGQQQARMAHKLLRCTGTVPYATVECDTTQARTRYELETL